MQTPENSARAASPRNWPRLLAAGLVCARLAALLGMTLEGLRGYGDLPHFFQVSSLPGWPFFHYWMEYPPVLAFLSALIARAAGGQEHVYIYLFYFVLTLADAGSLYLFARLAERLYPGTFQGVRIGAYLLVLLSVAYAWWNFDAIPVFWMLLGIYLLFRGRLNASGAALAAGILSKFFPGLALLAGWRRLTLGQYARWTALALLPSLLVWGWLWAASPAFTAASVGAQGAKGSWETVWALLDGNYVTGMLGPAAGRTDPASAATRTGQPARIPPWASLIVFGGLGLAGLLRLRPQDDRQSLAVLGFGWSLFLLWSPGWSPQWILYLLPLVLLALPERQALLFALMLVFINLLEWPILLSRGFFYALPLTIFLRTLLLALLAWVFYGVSKESSGRMV